MLVSRAGFGTFTESGAATGEAMLLRFCEPLAAPTRPPFGAQAMQTSATVTKKREATKRLSSFIAKLLVGSKALVHTTDSAKLHIQKWMALTRKSQGAGPRIALATSRIIIANPPANERYHAPVRAFLPHSAVLAS